MEVMQTSCLHYEFEVPCGTLRTTSRKVPLLFAAAPPRSGYLPDNFYQFPVIRKGGKHPFLPIMFGKVQANGNGFYLFHPAKIINDLRFYLA